MYRVNFIVVDDDALKMDVLLGRDVLKKNRICQIHFVRQRAYPLTKECKQITDLEIGDNLDTKAY